MNDSRLIIIDTEDVRGNQHWYVLDTQTKELLTTSAVSHDYNEVLAELEDLRRRMGLT